jgi:hypothetical protein
MKRRRCRYVSLVYVDGVLVGGCVFWMNGRKTPWRVEE